MIVDSDVFLDVFNPEDEQSERVAAAFRRLGARASLHLNLIIFAEISPAFASHEVVQQLVAGLGVKVIDLTTEEAFRAGVAFRSYRRNGGPRTTILPDFLIGAQAAIRGWSILTRDPKRFSSYFPEVELIDPLTAEP